MFICQFLCVYCKGFLRLKSCLSFTILLLEK